MNFRACLIQDRGFLSPHHRLESPCRIARNGAKRSANSDMSYDEDEPRTKPEPDLSLWLTQRPWLSLYGRHLGRSSSVLLAPIQQLLPDELMRAIFHKLSPAAVATASLVCKQWRSNSWKRMWVERPHVRCDGVYVSRNTYFRMGAAILSVRNPVHLVVFYRYYRFFPDGTLLTRTSPLPVAKVWPSLVKMPYFLDKTDSRLPGKWKLKGATLYTASLYPGLDDAEVRSKLKLRTCLPGLNNRLDVEEIFTYDRIVGNRVNLDDPSTDDEDRDAERITSRRGTNTLVFVPAGEVNSHIINLPKEKMDFWIPG